LWKTPLPESRENPLSCPVLVLQNSSIFPFQLWFFGAHSTTQRTARIWTIFPVIVNEEEGSEESIRRFELALRAAQMKM
jgi:hypothetical protein